MKYILILPLILFPITSSASIIITEIMFNPEGVDNKREWIEVQNIGDQPLDLTTYRFTENDTDHIIKAINKPTLNPNEIAIIADDPNTFNSEYKNVPLVFDSSFSLKNEGEPLYLKDQDKNIIHTANYHAGENNGYSYHLTLTSNFFAIATPGTIGKEPSPKSTEKETKSEEQEKTTPKETDNNEPSFPTYYKGEIQIDATVIAGNSHTFTPIVNYHRSDGQIISKSRGEVFINFGDGTIRQMDSITPIKHRYQYPGEYIIIFTYQKSDLTKTPNLTIKSVVNVIENPISLNRNNLDITITNRHQNNLDISSWQLKSKGANTFIFPENTHIANNATLTIPFKKFTYLNCEENHPIELYSKDNNLMSKYTCQEANKATKSPIPPKVTSSKEKPEEEIQTKTIPIVKGDILPTPPPKKEASTKTLWQLVGTIILISVGMIYLKHQEETKTITEKQLT